MIKLTKASAKEPVAEAFSLVMAPEVRRECVEQGRAAGYADSLRIEDNLQRGVVAANEGRRVQRAESMISDLGLAGGEADTLRLYLTARADLVVSDDRRFTRLLEGLAVPFVTPAGLLVALADSRKASRGECLHLLERMAPMISEEEYLVASALIGGG